MDINCHLKLTHWSCGTMLLTQEAVFSRKTAKLDCENPPEILSKYQRFSWRGAELNLKTEEKEKNVLYWAMETLGEMKGHSLYPSPQQILTYCWHRNISKEVGKGIKGIVWKKRCLALGITEEIFVSQKLFFQLPCNVTFLLPRGGGWWWGVGWGGRGERQKVDLHNLFLGVAMDPVSPF